MELFIGLDDPGMIMSFAADLNLDPICFLGVEALWRVETCFTDVPLRGEHPSSPRASASGVKGEWEARLGDH